MNVKILRIFLIILFPSTPPKSYLTLYQPNKILFLFLSLNKRKLTQISKQKKNRQKVQKTKGTYTYTHGDHFVVTNYSWEWRLACNVVDIKGHFHKRKLIFRFPCRYQL